jgi:hypothetical protein
MKTWSQRLSAIVIFSITALSSPAFASWYYNQNGGFGIYQPEGWSVVESGRSARMTGPVTDTAQTDIFLGSDWKSSVKTLGDLKTWLQRTYPGVQLTTIQISKLNGYRVGSEVDGAYYVLRLPENVIVVEYHLRGSDQQVDEGTTCLSSIEVRTKETR